MIDQTLVAISTNDSRPVHTGSLFQLEDGQLRVVSVDGFRLALRREKVSAEGSAQFIIPGKTLSEMNKLLSDEEDEETRLYLSRKHVVVQIGQYKVISLYLIHICRGLTGRLCRPGFHGHGCVPRARRFLQNDRDDSFSSPDSWRK